MDMSETLFYILNLISQIPYHTHNFSIKLQIPDHLGEHLFAKYNEYPKNKIKLHTHTHLFYSCASLLFLTNQYSYLCSLIKKSAMIINETKIKHQNRFNEKIQWVPKHNAHNSNFRFRTSQGNHSTRKHIHIIWIEKHINWSIHTKK